MTWVAVLLGMVEHCDGELGRVGGGNGQRGRGEGVMSMSEGEKREGMKVPG